MATTQKTCYIVYGHGNLLPSRLRGIYQEAFNATCARFEGHGCVVVGAPNPTIVAPLDIAQWFAAYQLYRLYGIGEPALNDTERVYMEELESNDTVYRLAREMENRDERDWYDEPDNN